MPNNNYANGAARERRIMKKLEKEGWFCIRSAGSHSPVDIVAFRRPASTRFIQSKATGYLTPGEKRKKEELERRLGINIEVI